MYKECELFYCDGLFLSSDEAKELNIEVADGIGLITLLQKYSNVFGMADGEVVSLDKQVLQNEALKANHMFCYIIKNNSLILPPIKIYYGIKKDNKILALWDSKRIRDIKLSDVKINNIHSIVEDMSSSNSLIEDFSKQLQLRKVYNSLTFKI